MLRVIKNLFKKNDDRQPDFEHGGHKFFVLPVTDINIGRQKDFHAAIHAFSLGISEVDLTKFIETCEGLIDQGHFSKLGGVFEFFKTFMNMYSKDRYYLALATCFILVDDEPNSAVSEKYRKLKEDLYFGSDEVRAFFLNHTLPIVTNILGSSDGLKIVEYLEDPKRRRREKVFFRQISQDKSTSKSS
jgi:hypothetical protein